MEKYKNTKGVLSDVPYMTSCEWLIIVGNTQFICTFKRDHRAKLPAKPIHSDLTVAGPANRPRSGFGQAARNSITYIVNGVTRVSYFCVCEIDASGGGRYLLGFRLLFRRSSERKRKKNRLYRGRSGTNGSVEGGSGTAVKKVVKECTLFQI